MQIICRHPNYDDKTLLCLPLQVYSIELQNIETKCSLVSECGVQDNLVALIEIVIFGDYIILYSGAFLEVIQRY